MFPLKCYTVLQVCCAYTITYICSIWWWQKQVKTINSEQYFIIKIWTVIVLCDSYRYISHQSIKSSGSDATLLSDVLKDQCTTAKCHKVTSHKTGFFSNINVRTSNLADFLSFIEHIFYFKLTIYWPSVITEHLNAILFTAVNLLYKLLDFMEHLHSTHFVSPWHFVLYICSILSHLHIHSSIV